MRKWYFLVLAGLLTTACSSKKEQTGPAVPMVNIDTLRAVGASATLQYPGRVKAADEVNLSFKVSGRIQRICVKEGDYVRAGQLVAVMDPTDYEVQLRATEAEHAQITAEAERVIKLHEEGATTDNNYDRAVYGKRQIDAKLKNHKDQLAYTRLTAPMSGYIQSKLFTGGEVVSAGMPVVTMLSGGAPEVEINLSATDYMNRNSFHSYTCQFDIFPGRVFRLSPVSTMPKANANQLYTMRLSLQAQGKDMPVPGMNTMVTIIQNAEGISQLMLPTSGVLRGSDGRTTIFIYDAQKQTLSQREVSIVRLLANGQCIVSGDGLHDGDLVVVSGTHHVSDGQKVKPLEATSKTNVGGML